MLKSVNNEVLLFNPLISVAFITIDKNGGHWFVGVWSETTKPQKNGLGFMLLVNGNRTVQVVPCSTLVLLFNSMSNLLT